jgi:gliding motility-associated-like protein
MPEPALLTVSLSHTDLSCYQSNDGTINAAVNGGNGGYNYSWNSSSVVGSSGSALIAGSYAVTISDVLGCTATDNTTILQPDEIVITMLQDTTVRIGHAVLIHNNVVGGVGAFTFDWKPKNDLNCSDCESPVSSTIADTEYQLLVQDVTGCTAAASVNIFVIVDKQLYIPNLFSPNSDGANDMFQIFSDAVKLFSMKIFNRWGEKVFESNDYKQGWDGYYKGELAPAGNYIYETSITYVDGQTEKRKGSVMLVR